MGRNRRRLGGFVVAVALFPGGAQGQTSPHMFEAVERKLQAAEPAPASSFQGLQRTLKVGQQVILTDDSGARVTGKVAELSASALVLLGPERRTFAQGNVTEIRLREDPVRNGTLIGLGAGALGGLGLVAALYSECGAGCEAPAYSTTVPPAVGFGAGVGALVGYLLDKVRKGDGTVVFSAARATGARPSVTLSPDLRNGRQGLLASVRF